MAFTNSPLVSYKCISPNKNTGRYSDFPTCDKPLDKITKITIHHCAAVMSVEQFGSLVSNPARQMSANYCIGSDGRIGLYCEEKDRSWCTGSSWNDSRAITIEVSNCATTSDWPISTTVYNSLIKLCVDICKRNGIKELAFTGDTNGSLTFHYQYQNTCCPGPWIKNHTAEICEKVNSQLKGGSDVKGLYTKTLVSGTFIYDEPGGIHTNTIAVTTKYTIVEEKVVGYIKYGRLKSGAGWVEVETLKRTFNSNSTLDIKELQVALNAHGFNCGTADGIMGIKTREAMFQALCEMWLQVK